MRDDGGGRIDVRRQMSHLRQGPLTAFGTSPVRGKLWRAGRRRREDSKVLDSDVLDRITLKRSVAVGNRERQDEGGWMRDEG